ncbi:hypothetical protein GUITHDRAFT_109643 [Guillardia theta CCMP2712]|uniref:Methyltransferase FkbM domain-containing protein n=1 Tax=Guillardia theta (strain CCMP2712) TaxID=905079 RepID=L1J8U1_GUITC|nr:hypothetical protein GUITHDRAFT_109643 [Guillardia theta CCMP2712]EKX44524.1 hypothetical protein GUITHDRAFT_109643 [Guillardia theta CCMP2712]|eukprot:XP_005831504.1 hypothetical protein GUITHDRAFT_109643 [Guillardia theta CCMP2712]
MVVYPFKDGTYDIVSNSVRLSGLWEPQESSIIQSLPRPSFFVDIGANIGWHSLLALSLGHRVVAFEPLHSNVNLLQHSLCLNPGLRENLELHTVALTDQKQHDCRIAFQDSNAGNGVLLCGNQSNGDPRGVEQNAEKTKIGRLDDYLHPGQDIDLIKIDVEGNELTVLRSGERLFDRSTGHRPPARIISEFAPRLINELGDNPADYLRFLDSKGYLLYHIERNVEAWDKPLHEADSSLTRTKTPILYSEFDVFTLKHWDAILTIDAILPRDRKT